MKVSEMWIESGEKMWSRKSSGWKKELSIGLETNEKNAPRAMKHRRQSDREAERQGKRESRQKKWVHCGLMQCLNGYIYVGDIVNKLKQRKMAKWETHQEKKTRNSAYFVFTGFVCPLDKQKKREKYRMKIMGRKKATTTKKTHTHTTPRTWSLNAKPSLHLVVWLRRLFGKYTLRSILSLSLFIYEYIHSL